MGFATQLEGLQLQNQVGEVGKLSWKSGSENMTQKNGDPQKPGEKRLERLERLEKRLKGWKPIFFWEGWKVVEKKLPAGRQ